MLDQIIKKRDDTWLIKLFKSPETTLTTNKYDVNWSEALDFKIFSEFLISDIKKIRQKLKNADADYLYYVCEHLFSIMDWIKLVTESGFVTFSSTIEQLFDKHFKNKHILQNIFDTCLEKWISQKRGQQKIGVNFYNIIEGKLYYRDLFGNWFEVNRKIAFDLDPAKIIIKNNNIINQLNSEYKDTRYDIIFKQWKIKQYEGVLLKNFLQFNDKETSPEAYYNFAKNNIKTLLRNPISLKELERWNGGKITNLEHLIKISALIVDNVKRRQKSNSHTVYLLRDSILFYEAHKILDFLNKKQTSSDQLLIGRKILGNQAREWGYYVAILQAIYAAQGRYPDSFKDFYKEYMRLMDMFVSLNPKFAITIASIAKYIKKHIQTDKNKVVIYDIGYQGSIALFTKYVIDRHIKTSIKTDLRICVGALWSKKLFGKRYESDYFPFLTHVQAAARSDQLYHYKTDSLKSGGIRVLMGNKKWQHQATIELVVLAIVAILSETNK